jgi:ketosteroid isomerase-like protein
MDNVELMKQGYQDFAEGNIEAILNLFHPEIEWNGCTGFPFITGDGIFIGSNTVVQEVLTQLPKYYENFSIDVKELFGCGDKVVMVGYYMGIWKAIGKRFKVNATHVWTLKDGKVIRFFLAVDTASIVNP